MLRVSDRRPGHSKEPMSRQGRESHSDTQPEKAKRKATSRGSQGGRRAPGRPEGWDARLREQARNSSRALELLEQALSMLREPRSEPLARAQCLRGAGLIALIAASELLLVAGWYEAEQAVAGGTRNGA